MRRPAYGASRVHPLIVVAGNKRDTGSGDSPDSLKFMDRYLADFEATRLQSADAQSLGMAMSAKYPDLAIPGFCQSAATAAFASK